MSRGVFLVLIASGKPDYYSPALNADSLLLISFASRSHSGRPRPVSAPLFGCGGPAP